MQICWLICDAAGLQMAAFPSNPIQPLIQVITYEEFRSTAERDFQLHFFASRTDSQNCSHFIAACALHTNCVLQSPVALSLVCILFIRST